MILDNGVIRTLDPSLPTGMTDMPVPMPTGTASAVATDHFRYPKDATPEAN